MLFFTPNFSILTSSLCMCIYCLFTSMSQLPVGWSRQCGISIHTFVLFNRIYSEQDKRLIECWEKFCIIESFKCELGHSLENYIKMASDPVYNTCFQHYPKPRQPFDSYIMQMGHDQPTQKCSALCKMRITFDKVEAKKKDKKPFIFSMLINFLIYNIQI